MVFKAFVDLSSRHRSPYFSGYSTASSGSVRGTVQEHRHRYFRVYLCRYVIVISGSELPLSLRRRRFRVRGTVVVTSSAFPGQRYRCRHVIGVSGSDYRCCHVIGISGSELPLLLSHRHLRVRVTFVVCCSSIRSVA